ncbi:MAG: anion permease, partial [Nitrospiraceae bacterium]
GGWSIVKFTGLRSVLEAMVLSPMLGFLVGMALMVLISWIFFRTARSFAQWLFRRLQLVSASFMAFSHGANDAQKAMGIITLALLAAGQIQTAEVPKWVIVSCALAMGLGTAMGGWKIVRTLGMRILKLDPVHGFAAETGAAAVLLAAPGQLGLIPEPASKGPHRQGDSQKGGKGNEVLGIRHGKAEPGRHKEEVTLPGAALLAALLYTGLSMLV